MSHSVAGGLTQGTYPGDYLSLYRHNGSVGCYYIKDCQLMHSVLMYKEQ